MPPSRVRIPPSPLRSTERCPSGLRSATGNRVRAERCVAGSNPALSALAWGKPCFPHERFRFQQPTFRATVLGSDPGTCPDCPGYARLVSGPVNVWDYEQLAERKLDLNAHAYFAGGAGD